MLAASFAALAEPQTQPPVQTPTSASSAPQMSATVKKQLPKKKAEAFTPLTKKTSRPNTDKIERVNGESSQPWAKMAGSHPGWSAFTEPERQDPTLNLFWIGAPPDR
jgi:hypothetical protein